VTRRVRTRRSAALTAAICVGLSASLTACGGEDPDKGTNGVQDLPAKKIEQKARAAVEGADSVRLSGTVMTKGHTYRLEMRLKDSGAIGEVATKGGETFSLLRVEKEGRAPGEPLLEVRDLHAADDRGLPAVRGVSFDVRAGEIVGIAGVDANGQSELIEAITGLRAPAQGIVRVGGRDLEGIGVRRTLDAGVGHIAEDRHRRGLVLEFTLAENVGLHDYLHPPYSHRGWLSPQAFVDRAGELIEEFDVRGGGPLTLASALSGGNQQKVVVAREVARDPLVLVAAQPTRGLDVGAIEYLHRRLLKERDDGRAILLVSLELDEVMSLSDRILVMYEGEIVAEHGPDVTEQEIGLEMLGGKREQAANVQTEAAE